MMKVVVVAVVEVGAMREGRRKGVAAAAAAAGAATIAGTGRIFFGCRLGEDVAEGGTEVEDSPLSSPPSSTASDPEEIARPAPCALIPPPPLPPPPPPPPLPSSEGKDNANGRFFLLLLLLLGLWLWLLLTLLLLLLLLAGEGGGLEGGREARARSSSWTRA